MEYAKLDREVRDRLLTEGRSKGWVQFENGVYSFNLDFWMDERARLLLSASA